MEEENKTAGLLSYSWSIRRIKTKMVDSKERTAKQEVSPSLPGRRGNRSIIDLVEGRNKFRTLSSNGCQCQFGDYGQRYVCCSFLARSTRETILIQSQSISAYGSFSASPPAPQRCLPFSKRKSVCVHSSANTETAMLSRHRQTGLPSCIACIINIS
jgi:hypothetical protein